MVLALLSNRVTDLLLLTAVACVLKQHYMPDSGRVCLETAPYAWTSVTVNTLHDGPSLQMMVLLLVHWQLQYACLLRVHWLPVLWCCSGSMAV